MADRPLGAGEKKRPALLQAAFCSGADGRNQTVDLLIANLPAELYKSIDQVGEFAPQFKKPTVHNANKYALDLELRGRFFVLECECHRRS
ncbi:hypothetical protein MKD49_03795 [Herbaspirillum sp. WGmk3]|uniref:hypothetical protein n=1 Tax=Herbaspirillum sp. WGmk3 TaxID=2919925 RepID=UPI002090BDB6|nr:hypothetical protein [Herbaspirillum sp. WGmk3]MCO4855601.1 hypothetical protein [Herbaspirillum sp. WGmk3]